MSAVFTDHANGVREVFDSSSYEPASGLATCGHCGRTWDDDHVSGSTPTPSGRCPFEYDHVYEED